MAAGGTPSNVTLGVGRLYIAPLGTAEPTDNETPLPSAWLAVGYTEDGSSYTDTATTQEVEVAEEFYPVRYVNTKRTGKLSFQMAEPTRRRLGWALAMGTIPENDTAIEPPTLGTEVAVMIVWDRLDTPGVTNSRRLWRQCKASGNLTLEAKKAPAKELLAVEFNVEKPDGAEPWKMFPSSTFVI